MKENYTHISVCVDRSGSMSNMAHEVVMGFNKFVDDQKKESGEATLSLSQFDDIYEVVHDFVDIQKMGAIKLDPRGSTALLDAMGQTLEGTRAKVLKMKDEDQPAKVIFVFITDGQENASSKYNRSQIFAMIKDLKSDDRGDQINWEFVFIGANQDAIAEGSGMGINARSAITFDASGEGATCAFSSLSKGMTSYRKCASGSASYTFDMADYDAQDKLLKSKGKATYNKTSILPRDIPDLDDGIVKIDDEDKV